MITLQLGPIWRVTFDTPDGPDSIDVVAQTPEAAVQHVEIDIAGRCLEGHEVIAVEWTEEPLA